MRSSWAAATTVVLPSGATTTINEGLVPARGLDQRHRARRLRGPRRAASGGQRRRRQHGHRQHDRHGGDRRQPAPTSCRTSRSARTACGFSAAGDAVRFNGSANAPSAAPIVAVTADTVSTGVGATMQPASSISGRVTNGRDPVAARVTAYDASSGDQITGVSAGADGRFTLAGLNSTGFHLVVTDPSGALRTSAWGSTSPDPATGATFTPAVGATLDAGTQAMTGKDCDPAVFHPGAANSGLHLANANLTDCDLSGEALVGADLHGASVQYAQPVGLGPDERRPRRCVAVGRELDRHHPRRRGPHGRGSLIGTTISGAQLSGATLSGIHTAVLGGLPSTLPVGWQVVRGYLVGPGAGLVGGPARREPRQPRPARHRPGRRPARRRGPHLQQPDAVLASPAPCSTARAWPVRRSPGCAPGWCRGRRPRCRLDGRSRIRWRRRSLSGPPPTSRAPRSRTSTSWASTSRASTSPGATISSWHLNGVTLTGAKFGGATINGINTEAIVGTPASIPSGWRFVGGGLIGPNAYLGGSPNLAGIDLHGLDLHGFGADGSNLSGANLSGTNLAGSLFTDVNLTGANFGAATLDWRDVPGHDRPHQRGLRRREPPGRRLLRRHGPAGRGPPWCRPQQRPAPAAGPRPRQPRRHRPLGRLVHHRCHVRRQQPHGRDGHGLGHRGSGPVAGHAHQPHVRRCDVHRSRPAGRVDARSAATSSVPPPTSGAPRSPTPTSPA